MIIKYKKTNLLAKEPFKTYQEDSCFDVYATSIIDYGDGRIKYGIGLAFDLPQGTRLDIRSRSSIHKTGLMLSNGIGTGDETYTDEYSVVFYNIIPSLPNYEVGDRIAQIHVEKVNEVYFKEVNDIEHKARGENNNGYGSTGLK
jgi:deoxyuridine 5'-triphosphate nucleotidohydrolase